MSVGGAVAFESWRAFYASELQGFWALLPVPALLLLALLARGPGPAARSGPARFVYLYALWFSAGTLADLLATGPLARALALSEAVATALGLGFVLLGDFRVFALVFALPGGAKTGPARAFAEAAGWTAIAPVFAWSATRAAATVLGDLPDQTLWLVHELSFVGLALWLRQRVIPRRWSGRGAGFLRGAAAYAAAYYSLWAASDLLILSGVDAGWGLRVLPNQLYYAFWTPFVYASFAARQKAATNSSAQASR